MSRWFRMYEEVLDDPKVQLLPPAQFKMWVNMLALTSRNNGVLPPLKDCAFAFRVTENTVSDAFSEFETLGLMERKDETFRPHNWGKRQYKSDTSTDRVKRFRKRSRNADVTASEADTETETDKNVSPKGEPLPGEPNLSVAVQAWNALADECGLSRVARMNDSRKRQLRVRLRECDGLNGWNAALAKIRGSPFCRGDNDRGWTADFDFILQPKSFLKLMEGKYDPKPRVERTSAGKPTQESDRRILLETLGIGAGFGGMVDDLGDPGTVLEGEYRPRH